jgi:hypothetical protein
MKRKKKLVLNCIVKVQAALNNPGRVLIYNEGETIFQESSNERIYNEILKLYRSGKIATMKAYCKAKITDDEINLQGLDDNQYPGW